MQIFQGAALELSADSTVAILSTQSPSFLFTGKAIQSPPKHSLKGKRTGQPHHKKMWTYQEGKSVKKSDRPISCYRLLDFWEVCLIKEFFGVQERLFLCSTFGSRNRKWMMYFFFRCWKLKRTHPKPWLSVFLSEFRFEPMTINQKSCEKAYKLYK